IMQALGTQPEVRVAVTSVQLSGQDGLLICSDGLSNKVTEQEMLQVVRQASDLGAACKELVEIANNRGGEDNITVIVARFDGDALSTGTSIDGSVRAVNEDFFSEEALSAIGQLPAPAPIAGDRSTDQTPAAAEADPQAATERNDSGDVDATDLELHESRAAGRRLDYHFILIFALISFLLLAAAAYLFYTYYLKQPAQPLPVTEPVG
ncbi:MAG TPA: SpoIIE family protein phosphatase, partial [Blastocatellia bacterium]|nr:SpoIIE family protein phosphatase [Blastocatellia bacterium]